MTAASFVALKQGRGQSVKLKNVLFKFKVAISHIAYS